MIHSARQSRSPNGQPRRLDRSQAHACDQHEDRVAADTGGIADVTAVEQRCMLLAVMASETPVL